MRRSVYREQRNSWLVGSWIGTPRYHKPHVRPPGTVQRHPTTARAQWAVPAKDMTSSSTGFVRHNLATTTFILRHDTAPSKPPTWATIPTPCNVFFPSARGPSEEILGNFWRKRDKTPEYARKLGFCCETRTTPLQQLQMHSKPTPSQRASSTRVCVCVCVSGVGRGSDPWEQFFVQGGAVPPPVK